MKLKPTMFYDPEPRPEDFNKVCGFPCKCRDCADVPDSKCGYKLHEAAHNEWKRRQVRAKIPTDDDMKKNERALMKIYQFDINTEKDWVCAPNMLEAIKTHISMTECDIDDYDQITEVPPEKWPDMYVEDDEFTGETRSFDEYMKTATSSDIIATTVR